jgi:hypothetical protein
MQCHSTASTDPAELPAMLSAELPSAAELPSMIATLCSYDRLFGPRHVQTLSLTARIAEVLWAAGDVRSAQCLLDRVVKNLSRTHPTRLAALNTLRDLALQEDDVRKAIALQTEIAECRRLADGPEAPETIAAKSHLGALLMSHVPQGVS